MDKKYISIEDFFVKSEINYLESFESFMNYLTEFLYVLSQEDAPRREKIAAEKKLIVSLVLIEKIHMHLFYRSYLYEQIFPDTDKKVVFQNKQNMTLRLLKELKHMIRHYSFQNTKNKEQCKKIISQILTYYQ